MVQLSSPFALSAVLCDFINLVLAGGIPHALALSAVRCDFINIIRTLGGMPLQ